MLESQMKNHGFMLWETIIDKKGKEYKFQSKDWLEKLKDKNFKAAVMGVLEDEFVNKYKKDS